VEISNATECRHSHEIATHAQKHKQWNLEKPATDVPTDGQIKEDNVEISERARLAQQSQGLLKEGESGSYIDKQFNEMLRAIIEERKQFLASEAEANGDDFLEKMVNGDYGFSKYDNESLKTILSDEQYAKLEDMYEQRRVEWEQLLKFINSGYNDASDEEWDMLMKEAYDFALKDSIVTYYEHGAFGYSHTTASPSFHSPSELSELARKYGKIFDEAVNSFHVIRSVFLSMEHLYRRNKEYQRIAGSEAIPTMDRIYKRLKECSNGIFGEQCFGEDRFREMLSFGYEQLAAASQASQASRASQEPGPSRAASSMYCNYVRFWYHEVFAEAHKNGTSFEEAMKTHGKEIAEFVVGENMKREALFKHPDEYPEEGREQEFLDELKAFLDGATRRINGESLKDAFEGYDIEKSMEKFGSAMNTFFMNRHEYFDKDSNSTIVGYWSDRYEKFVYPPKPEQSEKIKEYVSQKEDISNVSPQEKSAIRNAIFKNSAQKLLHLSSKFMHLT